MHTCVRENCKHISSDLKDQENRDMDFSSHLNYLRFSHYTFNYAARVSHSGKVTQSSNQWLMHKEAKVLQTAMTMLQMDLHMSVDSSNCSDHAADALHMTVDIGTRTGRSYSGREQPTTKPVFWVSVT